MITVTRHAWTGFGPTAVTGWSLIMKGSGAQPDWYPIQNMSPPRRSCGNSICTDGRPRVTHLEVDVEVADLSAYDAVFGTGEVA